VNVTDLPDPTIPGDPQATLEEAVPDAVFLPDPTDYSDDHPDLPGIFLSKTTVLLAFEMGTTVQEANDLLMPLGGQLVGGIQGVPGEVSSIVIVELATTSHQEMEAGLATLQADPSTLSVVQDALLETKAISRVNGGNPADWTWDPDPTGGNWGLELLRVPQMWNFNSALEKAKALVWTGVLDMGFNDGHEDFGLGLPVVNLSPGVSDNHGTGVAGIIAAGFDDGIGIDGVNPFTGLIVKSPSWSAATGPSGSASFAQALTNLASMMYLYPEMRVINISLGFEAPGDANTDLAWQQYISKHGVLFATTLQTVGSVQSLPLFLVAAGNESKLGFGLQQGKWQSPFCNAAIDHGAGVVLCIENVENDPSSPGEATRYVESNTGGHLSAPGAGVRSLSYPPQGYGLWSGTSQATPYVTGLVGYMLAVDPTLTIPQIRNALFDTSIPVGGFASNRIDAWAAVIEIDKAQGDERVLGMMLDIDDGTQDGNQRVDYDDGPDFPDYDEEDADGDGGLGDGKIDMSDFRVWRDWYLKIDGLDAEHFDGREDHPKMDVNDNGVTEDDAGESIYPRGDFNGDGMLSLEDSVFVPGAVQDLASDLDVLKALFDDPVIEKEDLDTLVHSSDITIDASIAFEIFATPPIRAEILKHGTSTAAQAFDLTVQEPRKTFTVRSASQGFVVWVRVGGPGTIRFADSSYKPLARWLATDAVMWPIKPVQVDVRSTFLNSCDDAYAATVQPISLASLKVGPGDHLFLDGAGGWPAVEELVAVFSASAQLETLDVPAPGDPSKTLTIRTVTDAISLGDDLLGGDTYASPPTRECGGVITDIPEDFTPFQVSFMKVPDGATHLFLGMGSDYYTDNEPQTDPIRVEISKWYAPEWHPMVPHPSCGSCGEALRY
jgi:hypothetical protein